MSEEERGDFATRFKVGNEAWKARSSHGRNPKFETPEELESACEEYFQWVCDNPLQTVELVKFQGEGTQYQVPKMRAMTIKGMCLFLCVNETTWGNYKKKPDFVSIVTRVEDIIFTSKLEGAAADMLNPNIIARELGLADKKETAVTGNLEIAGDLLYKKK